MVLFKLLNINDTSLIYYLSYVSRHLDRCSAYIAELWGVFEGLRLARERGISKIKVQVDSRVVVQTLNSSNFGLVFWVGELFKKFDNF
jgi:ribonuclease HI